MNITVDLYSVQQQVAFIAGNVPSKTPMEILKGVSIKAVEPGLLIMEATDMIAHVRQAIEANVHKPGEVFVDAQLLNGILTSMVGDGDVRLKVAKKLSITKGKQKRYLPAMVGEDFPDWPKPEFKVGWKQSAQSLVYQFKRVSFATAKDMSNPVLMGVNFNLKDGMLVGTDGRRMAYLETDIDKAELRPTFSPRFVQEIERSGMGGEISISVSDTWVRALSEDHQTVVWAIAMAGDFPPEAASIAKQAVDMEGIVFKMEKAAVVKSLHLAILYASRSRQPESSITLVGEGKKIVIAMDIPDVAELKDTIPGECAGKTNIQLSPQYLLDAANQIEADNITLKVIAEKTTVVITDEADKNWVVVQAGMHDTVAQKKVVESPPISDEEIREQEALECEAIVAHTNAVLSGLEMEGVEDDDGDF